MLKVILYSYTFDITNGKETANASWSLSFLKYDQHNVFLIVEC